MTHVAASELHVIQGTDMLLCSGGVAHAKADAPAAPAMAHDQSQHSQAGPHAKPRGAIAGKPGLNGDNASQDGQTGMTDRAQLRDMMAAAALARQRTQDLPGVASTPASSTAVTGGLESRQGTAAEHHMPADHDRPQWKKGDVPECSGTQRVKGTHQQQHLSCSGEDQSKQGVPGSRDAGAKLQTLQDVERQTHSFASAAAARATERVQSARPHSRQSQINSRDEGDLVIDLSASPFPAVRGHGQRTPQRHDGHKPRQAGFPGAWMSHSKCQKDAAVASHLCDDDKPASGILDLTDEHESYGQDGIEDKDSAVTSAIDDRICCPVCHGIWPGGSMSNADFNVHLDKCLSLCC